MKYKVKLYRKIKESDGNVIMSFVTESEVGVKNLIEKLISVVADSEDHDDYYITIYFEGYI